MNPDDLRCERQVRPLGLGEQRPRLSWKCISDARGTAQTAYRVIAARDPSLLMAGEDLLWDSGRVESSHSTNIEYAGPAAGSGERVWWTTQVWDRANELATAAPEWWEMGLLECADWGQAKWIGGPLAGGPRSTCPAPYLRAVFAVPGAVRSARLYVTALGLYVASLNGARIGDRELAPGWTDYRFRVLAQTYDVTDQVREGQNVLGFVLGDGWYCGHVFRGGRQHYGDKPLMLARLVVELADGSSCVVVSDDGFRVAYRPPPGRRPEPG